MSIRLSDERYEEIKRIVVEMYRKYKILCTPVSAFEIATKMGIKVFPYSSFPLKVQVLLLKKSEDGFSAQLQRGEWRIYYNDAKNYGRINNTLMHEIGHIVLDHSEDSDLAESEVKFFAKYALAPPVLIYKLRLTSPAEIEDNFQISHEAAQYAYNYYQKWLAYGSIYLTDYEMTMLELFDQAS